MINLSLAGLFGAVIGTIVAALVYVPLVDFVERGLRSRADSGAEGETLEQEISLLRRAVSRSRSSAPGSLLDPRACTARSLTRSSVSLARTPFNASKP